MNGIQLQPSNSFPGDMCKGNWRIGQNRSNYTGWKTTWEETNKRVHCLQLVAAVFKCPQQECHT